MNKNRLGYNFLATAYWNNVPPLVDLVTEPFFFLPKKADGSDDWSACEVVRSQGRKFTQPGRARTTVVMKTERLYSTAIGVLHRGQGTVVPSYSHTIKISEMEIPIHGILTKVSLFTNNSGGQFTFDVVDAVDFELVAIVEQEYFMNWLRGEILHPVQQAIAAVLPGIRRMMDTCGVDCEDTTLPTEIPLTYHGVKYLPGRSRNGVPGFDILTRIPDIMKKHPGDYQISIPTFLDNESIIELGRSYRGVPTKPYVGFSNEVWNPSPGFAYAVKFMNMRPAGMERAEWYMRNAIEKILLFEQGYGEKVHRVVEWQCADNWSFDRDPWRGNVPSIPYVFDNLDFFDLIGIAPYLFNEGRPVTQEEFDLHMPILKARCQWWKDICTQRGKKLFGYEGLIEIPGESHRAIRESEQMSRWVEKYMDELMPYFDDFCVYTGSGDVWGLIEGRGVPVWKAIGVLSWMNKQGTQTQLQNLLFTN